MLQFRHPSRVLFGLLLLITGGALASEPPALQPNPPERYRVQPGDTLWGIAERYLQDPWRWRELWDDNPDITNPHRIYPGDVLLLTQRDGQPRLEVEDHQGPREIRLSPDVRRESLVSAVPTIPIDAIQPFLSRPQVLTQEDLDAAPYVLGFVDEHIVGGAGDGFYARGIDDDQVRGYDLVRPGALYRDPDSGAPLGYEAIFVGDAQLLRPGDPAKLLLTGTTQEAQPGDRLLPDRDEEVLDNFYPRPAPPFLEGRIIAVLNGVSQIGQYNTVVLNRGGDDGLRPGDVLLVQQGGQPIRDKGPDRAIGNRLIIAPKEDIGLLMVFRVFDRVSFGLVMRATRAIHVEDWVAAPDSPNG